MDAGADEARVSLDETVDAALAASRALVGVAARSLAAEDDVTLPQYRTLVVLVSRGPQRMLSIAEALDVNQSTVTRMCERLERKGLVTRERPASNRRTVLVTATAEGRELVATVMRRRQRDLRSILRKLDPEAQVQVVTALRTFAEVAGEAPEQAWSLGWGNDR